MYYCHPVLYFVYFLLYICCEYISTLWSNLVSHNYEIGSIHVFSFKGEIYIHTCILRHIYAAICSNLKMKELTFKFLYILKVMLLIILKKIWKHHIVILSTCSNIQKTLQNSSHWQKMSKCNANLLCTAKHTRVLMHIRNIAY